MDEEERVAMEFFIACAADDHPVIPATGGFRKARWPGVDREKRRLPCDLLPDHASRTNLHGIDFRQVEETDAFRLRQTGTLEPRSRDQKGSEKTSVSTKIHKPRTAAAKRTKFGIELEQAPGKSWPT